MNGLFVPWSNRINSPGWFEDENGCHIWIGANRGGYAVVRIKGRAYSVYRLRYEREIGPIPDGMVLDHYVCNNGPGGCCNPFHCEPVTQRTNVLRGRSPMAINAALTHCRRGHPLEGDNLAPARLRLGYRSCLQCKRRREKNDYERRKQATRRRVADR